MIQMDNRNIPGAHGKVVGVAKFSNSAISWLLNKLEWYISQGDKNQHFYGMIRQAVHEFDFYGIDIGSSFFREVNTVQDYEDAKNSLK